MSVVIIGAGLSGLAVAHGLAALVSQRPVVLEARPRAGGRLLSVNELDLGGTWHWANERRVQALSTGLGVASLAQRTAGAALAEHANGVVRDPLLRVDSPSRRFVRGAQDLVNALLAAAEERGADVHLNTAVAEIAPLTDADSDDDGARFRLKDVNGTEYDARSVVIALPPALALEKIQGLDKLLSESTRNIASQTPVWMGGFAKVVIEFEEPFWDANGLSGAAMSQVGPMVEIHNIETSDHYAIFGFVPPSIVRNTQIDKSDVLKQLRRLFGSEMPEPKSIEIVDWSREEFTSPTNVFELHNTRLFGRLAHADLPAGLHFSSTETSTMFGGHMEGALEAAERTVERLKDDLKLC